VFIFCLWVSEATDVSSPKEHQISVICKGDGPRFLSARTEQLDIVQVRVKTVPWFRRLVAGISMWRSGFTPRPVRVSFVVGKMAQKTDLSPVPLFSPVSIIPPILHTHLHLHVALVRGTQWRRLETFQKALFFLRKSWVTGYKFIVTFTRDSRDKSGILMEIKIFS
jgi:hypothetical protein